MRYGLPSPSVVGSGVPCGVPGGASDVFVVDEALKTIRDEAESSTELDEGAMTLPPISLSRSV
jgi:hypothetical protein